MPVAPFSMVALLISMDKGIEELAECVHPHPSITEGIQECVRMLLGKSLFKPSALIGKISCKSCVGGKYQDICFRIFEHLFLLGVYQHLEIISKHGAWVSSGFRKGVGVRYKSIISGNESFHLDILCIFALNAFAQDVKVNLIKQRL